MYLANIRIYHPLGELDYSCNISCIGDLECAVEKLILTTSQPWNIESEFSKNIHTIYIIVEQFVKKNQPNHKFL